MHKQSKQITFRTVESYGVRVKLQGDALSLQAAELLGSAAHTPDGMTRALQVLCAAATICSATAFGVQPGCFDDDLSLATVRLVPILCFFFF